MKFAQSRVADSTLCNPMDYTIHGILQARILEWVTVLFCRGSSQPRDWTQPCLLHCWWILYQLSHQGSPRILEWIAYPFSRGSFRTRNRKQVRDADKYPASYRTVPHNKELSSPCIAGRFFPSWATREALRKNVLKFNKYRKHQTNHRHFAWWCFTKWTYHWWPQDLEALWCYCQVTLSITKPSILNSITHTSFPIYGY